MPDSEALAEFTGRTLAQTCGYLINQLPRKLNMKMDVQAFLNSFSYTDSDTGESRHLERWESAPYHHGDYLPTSIKSYTHATYST